MDATLHVGDVNPLFPEWEELYAADDRATPFQSPAWWRAWWRYWGNRSQPWLVPVRDAGGIVGLAALRMRRVAGLRILRALEEPGDYWDVLARPECRAAATEAIAGELRRAAGSWDALVVSRLPEGSGTAAALERSGLRPVRRTRTPCPAIDLPATFDAYLATLRSKRRWEVRARLKSLDGDLALRSVGPDDLADALQRWHALRIRQWAAQGKRLMRAQTQPRFRDFILDVTTAFVPAGRALVWEFVRGDQVVGSFVNFCDERAFYQYLGGYEPELGALRIGKLATAEGIRRSIDAGRARYDFGRGAEPYKYEYGAVDRFSETVVFTTAHARSRASGRLVAVRPGG